MTADNPARETLAELGFVREEDGRYAWRGAPTPGATDSSAPLRERLALVFDDGEPSTEPSTDPADPGPSEQGAAE